MTKSNKLAQENSPENSTKIVIPSPDTMVDMFIASNYFFQCFLMPLEYDEERYHPDKNVEYIMPLNDLEDANVFEKTFRDTDNPIEIVSSITIPGMGRSGEDVSFLEAVLIHAISDFVPTALYILNYEKGSEWLEGALNEVCSKPDYFDTMIHCLCEAITDKGSLPAIYQFKEKILANS